MSGLNFSLGGKLDRSFAASLNKAEAEAKAAALRIQSSLRSQISGIDKKLGGLDPASAEFGPLTEKKQGLQRALLIAQNAQFTAAARRRVAASAEEAAAAGLLTGKIAGLNLVMRESLVLIREALRGNFSRMPGSASLIAQGLAQMGPVGKGIAFLNKPLFNPAAANAEGAAAGKAAATGLIGALSSIPLVTMALVAGSLAAIIGAPILYLHRIKKEAEALATSIAYAFKPEHLAGYESKLEVLNQLQKDVAESARSIQEAHDSVGESMQRELNLTRDRLAFERELLEAQKANALAAAKNPAEREAIEKKFSKMILAKKKEEREADLAARREEAKQLPNELYGLRYQIASLTSGGGFMSEGVDAEILRKRRAAADSAYDYFKQLNPGEKDSRSHSADADRKLISQVGAKQAYFDENRNAIIASGAQAAYEVTDTEIANAGAARQRLANNAAAQQDLKAWVNSKGERDRARERVKELEKKVKDDSERLTKLQGTAGHGGLIADQERANLQKDKEDLRLEQERLKRVDAGPPLRGREVTERQHIGFGSPTVALLDVNKSMDRKLGEIKTILQKQPAASHGSFQDSFFNW